jgi:hypothetical protein
MRSLCTLLLLAGLLVAGAGVGFYLHKIKVHLDKLRCELADDQIEDNPTSEQ